ncbi:MAG: helix-turn-helix domain-containing protein [Saccharolobus sp.]|jgi:DNA-binding HxlR family transcriptional regulator|uniref:winged helix-turn-helix transcriptional regulator n=1 Tax=Saccharolobus sp. TaxID=2100761 RepID=UPI0028CE8B32|nr:helix-turn-helix domain-containing protein [Saccharolobus sp.]MDT7862537.1 helix-turn-helix domain-containing protein [Saccharolobus sp.]
MRFSNSNKPKELCPIVSAISVIGSEPKLLVIRYLLEGPKRFNELQRLTSLSSKTLSNTLKELENLGIVKRNIVNTRPLIMTYELTEKGKELKRVFDELRKWGEKFASVEQIYQQG